MNFLWTYPCIPCQALSCIDIIFAIVIGIIVIGNIIGLAVYTSKK